MVRRVAGLTAVLIALAPIAVAAQESVRYRASNMVGIGAAYQDVDAEVRSSVAELPPFDVNLDDLGVDTNAWSAAIEARWRFSPRWLLVGLAYNFDEDGRRTAMRDFNFDGKEFQAGASLETSLKMNTYILDVMYSVYANERGEFLLGGGIHAADLEATISGRAFVGDLEVEGATGSSELLAPLPNLRASAFYQLTDRIELSVSAGWLSANYEDYEGSFIYVHPRLGFQLAEKWRLTAGYQLVDVDVTYDRSNDRETEFEIDLRGPTVMIDYTF